MTRISVACLVGLSLAVAACGGGKLTPDEFEVVGRAPLVVPPEAELSPPRPGEPRAQEINPGRQAFEALFPGKKYTREVPKSNGERLILSRLRPSDPDIRSNVAQKDLDVAKKRLLLSEILDAEDRVFRSDNVTVRRTSGSN